MRFLRRFLTRVVNTALRRGDEQRLRKEIQEHLDFQTGENIRAGMSPREA